MAINQRTLYGIASGLSGPTDQGFLGGLLSGLSGTLGGFAKYADKTHEEERQRMLDMIQERRMRLAEETLAEQRAYHQAQLGRQRATTQPSPTNAPIMYGASTPEGDTVPVDVGQTFGVSNPALRRALDRQAVNSLFAPKPKTDAFSLWLQKRNYAAANPGPAKIPAAVQERVQLINSMDAFNPEHRKRLESIVANPPTPEEAQAAERKIRSGMNWSAQ